MNIVIQAVLILKKKKKKVWTLQLSTEKFI